MRSPEGGSSPPSAARAWDPRVRRIHDIQSIRRPATCSSTTGSTSDPDLSPEGELRDIWGGFQGIYSIRFTADGRYLWAGNGFAMKFLVRRERAPPAAATWGRSASPGLWGQHGFDTDAEGNLYEDYSGQVRSSGPAVSSPTIHS
jgi:hypothetical protein